MKRNEFFKRLLGLVLLPFIPIYASSKINTNALAISRRSNNPIAGMTRIGAALDAALAERVAKKADIELEGIGYDPSLESLFVRKVCRGCGIILTCHLGYDDDLYPEQKSKHIELYNNKNYKCPICRGFEEDLISRKQYEDHLEQVPKNIKAWKDTHFRDVVRWRKLDDAIIKIAEKRLNT